MNTHGGRREGAGRPPVAGVARCACGAMTLARALARCPGRHNAARCPGKPRRSE